MATRTAAVSSAKADKRAAMIAEAAYFAAERRHFQPGDALSDWLAAEQMVDAYLAKSARKKTAKKATAKKPAAKKSAATTARKGK